MSTITIDNLAKDLPIDDYQEQKVVDYNAVFAAMQAAWSSWTPSWTNLTLGNGVAVAKFRQVGKLVFCRLSLVFGSTTSIAGSVSFSLPVTRAANAGTAGLTNQGIARFLDASTGDKRTGSVSNLSTTTSQLLVWDSSGTYVTGVALSSTVPFTWTTSDEIACQFEFEAA